MRRTGVADLPLHRGRAPSWLFERMVRLARAMVLVMREDDTAESILVRLSEPCWFQAFGCVLGFDWHSSGVTTTVCGALKEAMRGVPADVGLFVAGGKGATSRKAPSEIESVAETIGYDPAPLVHASRMAAKVDSAALQDGYEIYHHTFVYTPSRQWTVIQQGMNAGTRYARRYHWLGERVVDFVSEPHSAVVAQRREPRVLNLVVAEGGGHRAAIARVAREERPDTVVTEVRKIAALSLPSRHEIVPLSDVGARHLSKILLSTYERKPDGFEALLQTSGLGARTLRALSLVAELMYGVPASVRDPATYAFAHGGKDGHLYPVDRRTYDDTIAVLEQALARARVGEPDRLDGLRRLASWRRASRSDP